MRDPLITQREEIRREIAAGRYRPLAGILLDDGIGRFLQRLRPGSKPVPFWVSAILMSMGALLVGLLVAAIVGEFRAFVGGTAVWMTLWEMGVGIMSMVAIRLSLDRLMSILQKDILGSISSSAELKDLQQCLTRVTNHRKQWLFSAALALAALLLSWWVVWALLEPGYPRVITTLLRMVVYFQAGLGLCYVLPLWAIAERLGRYEFSIFSVDPSCSEVIQSLSRWFNYNVLAGAFVTAYASLAFGVFGELSNSRIMVIWIIALWVAIVVVFVHDQRVLARIIGQAKKRKLAKIRMGIETLETQSDIMDGQVIATINELTKYYDRIRDTPDSAMNLRTGLNLVNSLLLPLLGVLAKNLGDWLQWLR